MRIEVYDKVANAWMQLLKGNLGTVDVFPVNALNNVKKDYVLITTETDTEIPLKTKGWNRVITRVGVYTFHEGLVDKNRAAVIANKITNLAYAGLPGQDDIQIFSVVKEQTFIRDEFDGVRRTYIIENRWSNNVFQKT